MHIAVDGISLYEDPYEIESLHVLEIVEAIAALPESPRITIYSPGDLSLDLPPDVRVEKIDSIETEWQRIRAEQRWLPGLAARSHDSVLISVGGGAALGSAIPIVSLEPVAPASPGNGLAGRLRWSLREAGQRGAARLFRYADLGIPESDRWSLPPFVTGRFRATPGPTDSSVRKAYQLPDDYVLALGVTPAQVDALLAAWTWVEGSVGDVIPLVVLGVDKRRAHRMNTLAETYDMGSSLRLIPNFKLNDLPAVYRGASAFLHPGPTRYGQELRWALATGIPVAAFEAPAFDELLGEAGYLAPPGDSRALGAACLTLLVESESVGRELSRKGLERAVPYHTSTFANDLVEAMNGLLTKG